MKVRDKYYWILSLLNSLLLIVLGLSFQSALGIAQQAIPIATFLVGASLSFAIKIPYLWASVLSAAMTTVAMPILRSGVLAGLSSTWILSAILLLSGLLFGYKPSRDASQKSLRSELSTEKVVELLGGLSVSVFFVLGFHATWRFFGYIPAGIAIGWVYTIFLISFNASLVFRVTAILLISSATAFAMHVRTKADDLHVVAQISTPRTTVTVAERSNSDAPQLLFVNNEVRFDASEEQSRYTCLTHLPMAIAEQRAPVTSALVLGGGSGIAARNLLSSPSVKTIWVVDEDPAIFAIAKSEIKLRMYHLDSLEDDRVVTLAADLGYLSPCPRLFDLIVVDLPIARAEKWIASALRCLAPEGVLSTHAGEVIQRKPNSILSPSAIRIRRSADRAGGSTQFYLDAKAPFAFAVLTKASSALFLPPQHINTELCHYEKNPGLLPLPSSEAARPPLRLAVVPQ